MSSRPEVISTGWLILLLLAGLLMSPPAQAARAVVNAALPDDEIVDRADLRAVFTLRKRQWRSGSAIKVYVLPDQHPVHERFVKEDLHLFPYQLRQLWNRLVFSGTGVAPQELEDEAMVLEQVRNNPNAIGYVDIEVLPEGVKAVPVSTPEAESP